MTLDLNHAAANVALDLYDTFFPAGSTLEIRTGSPAGAENAAGGTLLAAIVLPATPWNAAATGSKTKNGVWEDTAADDAGVAGHYRLKNAADDRREEGTASESGGGGDAIFDNTDIAVGQKVTVTTFTRTL